MSVLVAMFGSSACHLCKGAPGVSPRLLNFTRTYLLAEFAALRHAIDPPVPTGVLSGELDQSIGTICEIPSHVLHRGQLALQTFDGR